MGCTGSTPVYEQQPTTTYVVEQPMGMGGMPPGVIVGGDPRMQMALQQDAMLLQAEQNMMMQQQMA